MEENNSSNIPEFLTIMLEKQYGEDITKNIIKGYGVDRKTTLRVNNLKSNINEIKERLLKEKIQYNEISWSKDALVINENDQISKLDIYEDGKVYLQSLSSMLPPIILDPKEKENILDMAAAPGSKTTQIASITNNNSYITACEINNIRAERLKYNIEKQGVNCAFVMVKDARKLDDLFSFDKILLDAPCSGSGTISLKNENLKKVFTEKLINKSAEVQLALLRKAIKLLKPGGEMVYSTCSVLSIENEEIVEKALKGTKAKIVPIENDELVKELPLLPVKIEGTLCVAPNELYEGFFIAKIRKDV